MRPFGYRRPEHVADAISLLAEHGSQACILAGGTDLIVGLRLGRISPGLIVDIKRAVDLPAGIDATQLGLRISATATMADIERDSRIAQGFPALAEAASVVGSIQIRNRATLVGNICNASPAADTAPALLLYHALVIMTGPEGDRRLPLDQFIIGSRQTALKPGELVRAIELISPQMGTGSAFARLTRRRGVDLATVSLCCSVDQAGRVQFSYGAVAAMPFLLSDDSGVLADPAVSPRQRDRVLAELAAHASPISDVRASAEYRRAMLVVLSRRALQAALERRPEGVRR
jgi:CO/xanthine dehydrogenase FAD-binding subunit